MAATSASISCTTGKIPSIPQPPWGASGYFPMKLKSMKVGSKEGQSVSASPDTSNAKDLTGKVTGIKQEGSVLCATVDGSFKIWVAVYWMGIKYSATICPDQKQDGSTC